MSYKIKILGEISSFPFDGYYHPSMLESDLKKANGKDLIIDINSIGGCVQTGIGMYAKIRRYAKEHKAKVTTRADGFVASIATIIFLAGDSRVVNEFMQPFVHEPSSYSEGNASTILADANALEITQNIMAKFYSEHTSISHDEALDLMKNNTWMDAEYCLEIGFATEIEKLNDAGYKLVATLKNKSNINRNKNKMKKTNSSWFAKASAIFANQRTKALLELADVSGNSITFPDLETGDVPKEGDSIVVDGDDDFTGVVETDDFVIDVESGSVVSVVDKNEVDKDTIIEELIEIIENQEVEAEALKTENAKMVKLMKTLKSSGKPGTGKKREQEGKGKDSVSASLAKIMERNKAKK